MKSIVIYGRPEFVIPLKTAHIDLLIHCSKIHYDSNCKQASMEGGFVFGWKNAIEFVKKYDSIDEYPAQVTFSQLDLMSKILESANAECRKEAAEMKKVIFQLLFAANEESSKWRKEMQIQF